MVWTNRSWPSSPGSMSDDPQMVTLVPHGRLST